MKKLLLSNNQYPDDIIKMGGKDVVPHQIGAYIHVEAKYSVAFLLKVVLIKSSGDFRVLYERSKHGKIREAFQHMPPDLVYKLSEYLEDIELA